ncbi:MAG: sugar phosphate nucleotidyltransferase [Bacteroidales bacterium]|jgi:NDP-sugar pyrophosphorylase family protein|nr:sugar phosphate nucleotidyltransferase [Bacteroidales bacterium]
MKAMIFAAGIAKRLHPISEHTPKALVEIGGKTMLQRVAEKLIRAGARDIVINIHHHPEQMRRFIYHMDYPGARFFISDETSKLLDTGGGLVKAREWLEGDEPIVLHNVDVLSNIDIRAMLSHHRLTRALATLAVTRRSTARYFLWKKGSLSGWENTESNELILCDERPREDLEQLAFSGIHIIQPELFDLITEQGAFSINGVYLRLAKNYHIHSFEHDPDFWADIGTPKKLNHARHLLTSHPGLF